MSKYNHKKEFFTKMKEFSEVSDEADFDKAVDFVKEEVKKSIINNASFLTKILSDEISEYILHNVSQEGDYSVVYDINFDDFIKSWFSLL